jgi:3-hydroxy-9,10-secoandrosta-1,3,5(10)-triene-9,17-dione monooxygenase
MSNQNGFNEIIAPELIERAKQLRPFLLQSAAESERNRRLSNEIIRKLDDAELFKVNCPRRWGGLCASARTAAQIGLELAKGCPSTGWIFAVSNFSSWNASIAGDALQSEVFTNGIPIMCTVGNPLGSMKNVDGGIQATGSWPYSSACLHSSWGAFAVGSVDEQGKPTSGYFMFVPMSEVTIEDTWQFAALRATGSNTVIATDLFVPRHRLLALDTIGSVDAEKKHGEATDYFPFEPYGRCVLLGVLVGMSEPILEHVVAYSTKKKFLGTSYQRQADSQVIQKEIGEAAAMINAARLLMIHAVETVDQVALSHQPMSPIDAARNRCETAMATDLLAKAVEKLMSVGGTGLFSERNDMQRFWRDLNVAARHPVVVPHVAYENYGRELIGIEQM